MKKALQPAVKPPVASIQRNSFVNPFQLLQDKNIVGNPFQQLKREAVHQPAFNPIQLLANSKSRYMPGCSPCVPVQLAENGRWWGSAIGSALGGLAGAAAGYSYGAMNATASAVTGGVADAVKGYQHGGITGAIKGGAYGAASNAVLGFSSGTLHGASVGMKLGSAIGSGVGDWWTGKDKPPDPKGVDLILEAIKHNLKELNSAEPLALKQALENHPKVQPQRDKVVGNDTKILNWLSESLSPGEFNQVLGGGQVRVPYDESVFNGLRKLGAEERASSHYSGTLFVSGFSLVVGEQYGTTGSFLPTVLFGKIIDRAGKYFMYFQPEKSAFNPKTTSSKEKKSHTKDALKYARTGVQQGPHGESSHTDGDPITGSGKYQPTFSDKFGYARAKDFEAFAANLLYASGGSSLLSAVGVRSKESRVAAMHFVTMAGLPIAYAAWKKFNG
jgi:hypothetical protein